MQLSRILDSILSLVFQFGRKKQKATTAYLTLSVRLTWQDRPVIAQVEWKDRQVRNGVIEPAEILLIEVRDARYGWVLTLDDSEMSELEDKAFQVLSLH